MEGCVELSVGGAVKKLKNRNFDNILVFVGLGGVGWWKRPVELC